MLSSVGPSYCLIVLYHFFYPSLAFYPFFPVKLFGFEFGLGSEFGLAGHYFKKKKKNVILVRQKLLRRKKSVEKYLGPIDSLGLARRAKRTSDRLALKIHPLAYKISN